MKAKIINDGLFRLALGLAKNTREQVMLLLSAKAGLRAKEIAGLKWGCVREDDTVLELVTTKGGEPRTVPINKELRAALQAYRVARRHTGDDHNLFTQRHSRPGEPLTANAVAAWFGDFYTRRLGWEGYSSHSGRRTFATQAARKISMAGGSLKDMQQMLGHASLATMQEYIEGSSDAKRRLVEMI